MARTLWWQFTGNGGPITVSSAGSNFDTVLAVYDSVDSGSVPTEAGLVTCDDDTIGRTSELTFQSVSGRTYWVQLGGCTGHASCGAIEGDATLRLSAPSPPSNDNHQNAAQVGLNQLYSANTIGATIQADEPLTRLGPLSCVASRRADATIWYRVVGNGGPITLTTRGSSFDTVLAVYDTATGTPTSSNFINCNDDISGQDRASELTFNSAAGRGYLVQVGGCATAATQDPCSASARGSVQFAASTPPPPPDCDLDNDGINGRCEQNPPDCDDANPDIKPGAVEQPNNNVDENCDGVLEFDSDSDGARLFQRGGARIARPGADCDDNNRTVKPGAPRIPGNGVDDDCDGKPEPYPRAEGDASIKYRDTRNGIRVRSLVLTKVTSGARVEFSCRRKGKRACKPQTRAALSSRAQARAAGTVGFPRLRRKSLRAGTIIEIRITKERHIGAYIRYQVKRAGHSKSERRINPGSKRPCRGRTCITEAF